MQTRKCPFCLSGTKVSVSSNKTGAAVFKVYCPNCDFIFEQFVKEVAVINAPFVGPSLKGSYVLHTGFQQPRESDEVTLTRVLKGISDDHYSKAFLGTIRDTGVRTAVYEVEFAESDIEAWEQQLAVNQKGREALLLKEIGKRFYGADE